MQLPRFSFSAFSLGLLLAAFAAAPAHAQSARIVKIVGRGSASLTHAGASARVRVGQTLATGDLVVTAADVQVYLQPHEGAILALQGNSRASFSVLTAAETEITLTVGSLVSQLAPGDPHRTVVRTEHALTTATSTIFTVNAQPDSFSVFTVDGQAYVTAIAGNSLFPVQTGKTYVWNRGRGATLSDGSAPPAATDLATALAAIAVVAADTTNFGANAAGTAATVLTTNLTRLANADMPTLALVTTAIVSAAPTEMVTVVTTVIATAVAAARDVPLLTQTVTAAAAQAATPATAVALAQRVALTAAAAAASAGVAPTLLALVARAAAHGAAQGAATIAPAIAAAIAQSAALGAVQGAGGDSAVVSLTLLQQSAAVGANSSPHSSAFQSLILVTPITLYTSEQVSPAG